MISPDFGRALGPGQQVLHNEQPAMIPRGRRRSVHHRDARVDASSARVARRSFVADVDAAELSLAGHPVTHLVQDVQFSGEFSFEGLHFYRASRAVAPQCRIVQMHRRRPSRSSARRRALVRTGPGQSRSTVYTRIPSTLMSQATPRPTLARTRSCVSFSRRSRHRRAADGFSADRAPNRRRRRVFGFEALTRVSGAWLDGWSRHALRIRGAPRSLAELNLLIVERAVEAAAGLPASRSSSSTSIRSRSSHRGS